MNQLTSTFDKKWTSYALAGGAILIAPMAKGDLITTPQNISLPTTTFPTTTYPVAYPDATHVNVDIDGDGQFDYTFFVSDPSVSERSTGVQAYGSTTNKIFADPDTFPSGPFATVTSLGSAPDPTSVLKGEAYFLKDGIYTTKGNWNSDITDFQYVGLQFTSSGITYMGWADVSVELEDAGTSDLGSAPSYLKIDQTAYSVATPEPSSMALMLLGAAGVAALKRRRRSVQ